MKVKQFEDKSGQQIERNYQGNESMLLFSRLRHPIIKKQACDLMYQMEQLDTQDGKQVAEDGKEEWPKDEFFAPSRENIENTYDRNLKDIEKVTYVKYDTNPSHSGWNMALFSINPLTNKRFTTKEMSIIEAHEKGHLIRTYDGPQYDEYFRQGFDLDKVTITDEELSRIKIAVTKHPIRAIPNPPKNVEDITNDMAREAIVNYTFSGVEIAERMNQLKNYFGFKGTEQFTKPHLDIARKHYITDTGMDNEMTIFFEAITPETESKFLELMNSSGI